MFCLMRYLVLLVLPNNNVRDLWLKHFNNNQAWIDNHRFWIWAGRFRFPHVRNDNDSESETVFSRYFLTRDAGPKPRGFLGFAEKNPRGPYIVGQAISWQTCVVCSVYVPCRTTVHST